MRTLVCCAFSCRAVDIATSLEYQLEHALVKRHRRESTMTAWPDLLVRTYEVVRTPVALLDERLFDRATPCADWTVGGVFGPLAGALDLFGGGAGAPPAAGGTGSPLERYDAAVRRNLDAWAAFTDHGAAISLP